MKKILAMAIGAAVVASFASAQTYSKNAVGFINIPAEAEGMYALTVPFDNLAAEDGSWYFEDTQLAKDAANGSVVYIWDGAIWQEFTKGKNGFAMDDEYAKLMPGQCFFFQPSEDMVITMTGEVPDTGTTLVPVTGAQNLSAIGNPYPTDVVFEDTQLAQEATSGSTVYIWDGAIWQEFTKGKNGFAMDDEFATIPAGTGFFFQTAEDDESSNWEVEKEYEWP